ncbi:hypothetical protein AB1Y20_001493 [Prymnesium parvum]|uniref:Uncharacterized protein n=1 Tax=Prymnesium parvum TaxID=97485 RepID=A0AB34KBV0_PRYPA
MGRHGKTKAARPKGGGSSAARQLHWKAAHARRQGLSSRAHGGECARRAARVRLAEARLRAAEAAEGAGGGGAAASRRLELADALVHAGEGGRAVRVLRRCVASDAEDRGGARRRLAPLLLRLGEREEAARVLREWGGDGSAVMCACRLLLSLGGGAAPQACEAALGANGALCWLLAAPRARSAGAAREALPEALLELLRELRGELYGAAARPAAGGLEEALLLITGEFEGWAAGEGDGEWGSANEEGGGRLVRELCKLLPASLPEVSVGSGENSKLVAFMKELLDASAAEVRQLLDTPSDVDEEEEEGGEDGEEDGGEDGEEDREEDVDEGDEEEGEEEDDDEDDEDSDEDDEDSDEAEVEERKKHKGK